MFSGKNIRNLGTRLFNVILKWNYFKKLSFIIFLSQISFAGLSARTDTLFQDEEILKIELRSDFSKIQGDRTENSEYQSAELFYYPEDGDPVRFEVRIMSRGNFRRDPDNCRFPPLFINFKKSEVKNTVFDSQDKLKLVTPCQNETDVVKEYTIYKMYNMVTDYSLRVRLARILYFDTSTNRKLFERSSFFIEDEDHAARRNNAHVVEKILTPFDLNRENVKRMSVFQYLIGNKDWFITSRKNIVIMQPDDSAKAPYAVPYDFDFAAFVNAGYTKPKGVPDDKLATRRVFKGICLPRFEIYESLDFYNKLRLSFEAIIKKQKLLPNYNRSELLIYIDSFYTLIENPDLVKQEFIDQCESKKDYNIIDI